MKHRKKLVLIVFILTLVEFASVFLMYKSFTNKNILLDKATNENSNMFAIMLEDNNGNYVLSSNSAWPTSNYVFNEERSVCIDSNGNKLTNALEFSNGIAKVKTTKEVSCYLYFDISEGEKNEAFAIYSETDNSLRFYKNDDKVKIGETYKNLAVTEIYKDFEISSYEESEDIPWEARLENIITVEFVDEIIPISTAYWFSDMLYIENLYLDNLNTSKVTDMSYMFALAGQRKGAVTATGIENFDTSNVSNMSYMFGIAYIKNLDLSDWNTQNVTNMSYMFYCFLGPLPKGIKNFDTSNVSNMSYMFADIENTGYTNSSPLDLSQWDVSSINTSSGFYGFSDRTLPSGSIIHPDFAVPN